MRVGRVRCFCPRNPGGICDGKYGGFSLALKGEHRLLLLAQRLILLEELLFALLLAAPSLDSLLFLDLVEVRNYGRFFLMRLRVSPLLAGPFGAVTGLRLL